MRSGVVGVIAGLGHGTGFFVGLPDRVVITNDHVLGNSRHISVVIDSATRIPGRVLARDRATDLAVLQISEEICPGCSELPLALDRQVQPGQRVIAVGYPLSQGSSLSSGVVSTVRGALVMSDVHLNPGNSGGPLVDMHLRDGESPPATLLPVLSSLPPYPIETLLAAADSFTEIPSAYRDYDTIESSRFTVTLSTPLHHFAVLADWEREIAGERRIGDAPMFPSRDDPATPITRHVADHWVRKAEELAGLPHLEQGCWHPARRGWATARSEQNPIETARAGGWSSPRTMQMAYQHATMKGMLRVVEAPAHLREETGS